MVGVGTVTEYADILPVLRTAGRRRKSVVTRKWGFYVDILWLLCEDWEEVVLEIHQRENVPPHYSSLPHPIRPRLQLATQEGITWWFKLFPIWFSPFSGMLPFLRLLTIGARNDFTWDRKIIPDLTTLCDDCMGWNPRENIGVGLYQWRSVTK